MFFMVQQPQHPLTSLTWDLDERFEICQLLHKRGGHTSLNIRYLPARAEDVKFQQLCRNRAFRQDLSTQQGGRTLLCHCQARHSLLVYVAFFKVRGFLSFSQTSVIEIISFTFFQEISYFLSITKKIKKSRKSTGQDGQEMSGRGHHQCVPGGASSLPGS